MIQRVQFSRSEPEFRNRQRLALLLGEVRSTVPAHMLSKAQVATIDLARRLLESNYPTLTIEGLTSLEYCQLLVKILDQAGVVYWKAGWFWSSSEPTKRVLCVARSIEEKTSYERHEDFICWVN